MLRVTFSVDLLLMWRNSLISLGSSLLTFLADSAHTFCSKSQKKKKKFHPILCN